MERKTLLFFPFLTLFSFFACSLTAQVEKVYYQSLSVSDSTMQLEFNINDPHEVIAWHHEGRMMVEITARLEGGNMDILGFLIKNGRYNVALDEKFPVTTLNYVAESRPAVKNKGEFCKETVFMRIFVPEGFTVKKTPVDNLSITNVPKETIKN